MYKKHPENARRRGLTSDAGWVWATADELHYVAGMGGWTSKNYRDVRPTRKSLLESYLVVAAARPPDTWGDVDPHTVRTSVLEELATL